MNMESITFNTKKVVLNTDKLKAFALEKGINLFELVEQTLDDVYEFKFSDKKNKINIKRKPSQKQKEASKNNIKKVTPKTDEKVMEFNQKLKNENYELKTKLREVSTELKVLEGRVVNPEKLDSQQSSVPYISVAMLHDTSSGDTSQGESNELCTQCKNLLSQISEYWDGFQIESVDDIKDIWKFFKEDSDKLYKLSENIEKLENVIIDLYEAHIIKIQTIINSSDQQQKIEKAKALDNTFHLHSKTYKSIIDETQ